MQVGNMSKEEFDSFYENLRKKYKKYQTFGYIKKNGSHKALISVTKNIFIHCMRTIIFTMLSIEMIEEMEKNKKINDILSIEEKKELNKFSKGVKRVDCLMYSAFNEFEKLIIE